LISLQKHRINILFVIMQMEMGGAERLVYNIISKLDRKIFNPSIAWFFGDKILDEFKRLEIPLYHVPKIKRFDFGTMRKLSDIIGQNDIHIINAHNFLSLIYSFYGCKIANNKKLIYTEHSAWEIDNISWMWKRTAQYLLRYSDGLVGVSATVSRRLQEILKTKLTKTFSIQNGVDCNLFSNSTDREGFRKRLGIESSDQVIGVVANFKRLKNHIFLLKTVCELLEKHQNLKLIMIGKRFEGDEARVTQELEELVKEKGLHRDVLFLGCRSDVPDLLSIMDIFCLTSFKEGLPISLIEAMAAGLPVVGTDVEGIRDVIIPNRNGFLVQLEDIDGLKKVLSMLLQDESMRKRMGQESREMARSRYSLDRTVDEYQNLFLSVVEEKP